MRRKKIPRRQKATRDHNTVRTKQELKEGSARAMKPGSNTGYETQIRVRSITPVPAPGTRAILRAQTVCAYAEARF